MSSLQRWTVFDVISWSAGYFKDKGSSTPRLDAELLLGHVLDCDRVHLYMNPDKPLLEEELAQFKALALRRVRGASVAHLTGRKEFWKTDFEVPDGVFVPRPETEFMVEFLLDRLDAGTPLLGADLCCGTGAVGLTMALEREADHLILVDLSQAAVDAASRNGARLELAPRIRLERDDAVSFVQGWKGVRGFDYITCNPPYVPSGEWDSLAPEIRLHEPPEAIISGEDGLELLKRLIREVPRVLVSGGWFVVEYSGEEQTAKLRSLLEDSGFLDVTMHRDLAGLDRIMTCHT